MDFQQSQRERFAELTAVPMFTLGLTFLILLSVPLTLAANVVLDEASQSAQRSGPDGEYVAPSQHHQAFSTKLFWLALWTLSAIWPLFVAEYVTQYIMRDRDQPFWKHHWYGLLICICPPLRIAARSGLKDGRLWLPVLGWKDVDDELRARLERWFSIPMVFIALMILPILLIEHQWQEFVHQHLWLSGLLMTSQGVIWLAFAFEFILMVSVAEKRLDYCKRNWLDLVIILIPFIYFLRSLRMLRLARLAKLQQLSKMSRVYRLRGLAMRGYRAILILEILQRMIKVNPEKRLLTLRNALVDKKKEVEELEEMIADLEKQVEDAADAEASPSQSNLQAKTR